MLIQILLNAADVLTHLRSFICFFDQTQPVGCLSHRKSNLRNKNKSWGLGVGGGCHTRLGVGAPCMYVIIPKNINRNTLTKLNSLLQGLVYFMKDIVHCG